MKVIKPSFIIESMFQREVILPLLEAAGRTCYRSEGKIGDGTAGPFVRNLCQVKKHESVIEHVSVTVRFIVDRGVSHELVRHRLASYSQESTRYCNYGSDKFGDEITVIQPPFFIGASPTYALWYQTCLIAERAYLSLLQMGAKPEEARSVLPNSLKTEIVMTANLREWRHVFKMRTSPRAHPQMREVMVPLLELMALELPEVFDDICPTLS